MSKLLIDESPLVVLPSLAKAIGLEEAIVLQQIHYRMRMRAPDANEWVPCGIATLVEWCPFLTERSMKRIMASLKEQGMIEVAQRAGFDRTNWLRVRYEALSTIGRNRPIDGAKSVPSDEAKPVPSMGPILSHLSLQDIQKEERREERARKRASRHCPADFEVTEEMRQWAAEHCPGVDLLKATAVFMDHEFSSGKSDWEKCWRNWMRKERPTLKPARPAKAAPTEEEVMRARQEAIEANRRAAERMGYRP